MESDIRKGVDECLIHSPDLVLVWRVKWWWFAYLSLGRMWSTTSWLLNQQTKSTDPWPWLKAPEGGCLSKILLGSFDMTSIEAARIVVKRSVSLWVFLTVDNFKCEGKESPSYQNVPPWRSGLKDSDPSLFQETLCLSITLPGCSVHCGLFASVTILVTRCESGLIFHLSPEAPLSV